MKFTRALSAVALLVTVAACQKVERIEVSPATLALSDAGKSAIVTPNALNADGKPMTGLTFQYTSSDPAVATVDGTGKVTAVKSGTATITVASGEKTGTAAVDVRIPAKIVFGSAPLNLHNAGTVAQLQAEVQDALGRPVPNVPVSFTVENAAVAKATGTVLTAVGEGNTKVVATAGALTESAPVVVTMPAAELTDAGTEAVAAPAP